MKINLLIVACLFAACSVHAAVNDETPSTTAAPLDVAESSEVEVAGRHSKHNHVKESKAPTAHTDSDEDVLARLGYVNHKLFKHKHDKYASGTGADHHKEGHHKVKKHHEEQTSDDDDFFDKKHGHEWSEDDDSPAHEKKHEKKWYKEPSAPPAYEKKAYKDPPTPPAYPKKPYADPPAAPAYPYPKKPYADPHTPPAYGNTTVKVPAAPPAYEKTPYKGAPAAPGYPSNPIEKPHQGDYKDPKKIVKKETWVKHEVSYYAPVEAEDPAGYSDHKESHSEQDDDHKKKAYKKGDQDYKEKLGHKKAEKEYHGAKQHSSSGYPEEKHHKDKHLNLREKLSLKHKDKDSTDSEDGSDDDAAGEDNKHMHKRHDYGKLGKKHKHDVDYSTSEQHKPYPTVGLAAAEEATEPAAAPQAAAVTAEPAAAVTTAPAPAIV